MGARGSAGGRPGGSQVSPKGLALALFAVLCVASAIKAVVKNRPLSPSSLVAYQDSEGRYRAVFPEGKPDVRKIDKNGVKGSLRGVERSGWVFMVGYYDLPDGLTLEGSEYDALKEELAPHVKGFKLKAKGAPEEGELAGAHALTQQFERGVIRLLVRDGTRVYTVACLRLKQGDFDPEVGRAFLAGFQLAGD